MCVCVCVQTHDVFERQKDEFKGEGKSDGTLLSYTAWTPVKTWVGFTVTHKDVYEHGSSLHGSLSWDCKKLWGNFTLMLRIKIMMNVLSTYNVPGNFLRALIHVKSHITHNSMRLILFLSHSTDEKKNHREVGSQSLAYSQWIKILPDNHQDWRGHFLWEELSVRWNLSPLNCLQLSHGIEATALSYSNLCAC